MRMVRVVMEGEICTCDPGGVLPAGYYMQTESKENPEDFILLSRTGSVYRVRKRELFIGFDRGAVKKALPRERPSVC